VKTIKDIIDECGSEYKFVNEKLEFMIKEYAKEKCRQQKHKCMIAFIDCRWSSTTLEVKAILNADYPEF
jgi:hypothetical protein